MGGPGESFAEHARVVQELSVKNSDGRVSSVSACAPAGSRESHLEATHHRGTAPRANAFQSDSGAERDGPEAGRSRADWGGLGLPRRPRGAMERIMRPSATRTLLGAGTCAAIPLSLLARHPRGHSHRGGLHATQEARHRTMTVLSRCGHSMLASPRRAKAQRLAVSRAATTMPRFRRKWVLV